MKKAFLRGFAFLLVLSMCVGTTSVFATNIGPGAEAENSITRASNYLSSYHAWLGSGSNGIIYVYYDVDATRYMDVVGVTSVVIQQKNGSSWNSVKNFIGTTSNGMLTTNDSSHTDYLSYKGTSGKTYRAVVTFYAELNGGYDTRTLTTSSIVAP